MAYSSPVTHVTSYTVTADDWNELVNDLKYLKGEEVGADGGVIVENNVWTQGKHIVGGTVGPGSYVSVDSFVLAGVHVPGATVNIYGLNNQYTLNATANCGTFYGYYGAHTIATGAGNALTTYIGALFGSPTVSSGSITTAYGAYIQPQTSASSNNYGLYIGAPSGGGGSDIGLYVAGGDTGVYVLAGGLWVAAGGMVIEAGGIDVTGVSTITGTLGGITTLTATTLTGTLSTVAQPNITSVGTLTGLTVSAGANASTTLTVGQGGAAPSAQRQAVVTVNAPSSGTYLGRAFVDLQRAGTTAWQIGVDEAGASGAKAASGDLYFWTPSAYRMALSTAGALTTAAGITMQSGTMALGANSLTMTGTIAATGSRVTQSYHTNITSTNAVTVDSSLLSKVPESIVDYQGDALSIIRAMRVVGYRHHEYLDPSNRVKLGVTAESIREPLVLQEIESPMGGVYPGVNLMALLALQTRAIQQLEQRFALLGGAA